MRIETAVTGLLGIELPVLCSGAALAVSAAGGLGVVPGGLPGPDLVEAVAVLRAATGRPFGVELDGDDGAGVLLAHPVPVVIACGAGLERYREAFRGLGTSWLQGVASVEEARAAGGADALVVRDAAGGFALLRAIARALPGARLIAAGVTEGSELVAALALGAGAVAFDAGAAAPAEGAGRRVRGLVEAYVGAVASLPRARPVRPVGQADRSGREAAALRANLARRKAQSRERGA